MITGIDNIGLGVTDLARSVTFYQRLSFTKVFENDRGITMLGSTKLFLFPANATRGSVSRSLTNIHSNPPGIDHISFLVDDVDKSYDELIAAGVEIETKPADQSWGARAVSLRDPDGNSIYLLVWLAK